MTEEDLLVKVILAIRDGLTQTVEQLNEILAALAPETTTPEREIPVRPEQEIPRIDLGELEDAGWISYRTKKPAKPEEAAWMKNPAYFTSFEPPPVIFELVKAIKRSPGERLQLGDKEYTFSGEGKFITRKPMKV